MTKSTPEARKTDATRILRMIGKDPKAANELMPIVYQELRHLAEARMARESPGHTLQATALVHEAYLRLVNKDGCRNEWASRAQFFKAAAEAMRRILIDRARRKRRIRHGGELRRENVDDVEIAAGAREDKLLDMDEAISAFQEENKRAAQVVEFRFFIGLTHVETAEILGVSLATVEREWAFAKAWLFSWIEKNRKPVD